MQMIVGNTWVTERNTGQRVDVVLTEQTEGEWTVYKLMKQDCELGHVSFKLKVITDADLATRHHFSVEKVQKVWHGLPYLYYGPVKDNVIADKVYIKWICSSYSDQYRGSGIKLMQSVIEKSLLLGCKGRVDFNAAESMEFYYSMGFRSFDDSINAQLEEAFQKAALEGGRVKPFPMESSQMYLPEKGLSSWKETIQKEPILTPELMCDF